MAEVLSHRDHPFVTAVRLLGRELMDLVQKRFDAHRALPRAVQAVLTEEQIAAIRAWQRWKIEQVGGAHWGGAVPLIDRDVSPAPAD
jgi:hypothetical protein